MKQLYIFFFILGMMALVGCRKPGCTDPRADNYNPKATESDGSCTYSPPQIKAIKWKVLDCQPPYNVELSAEIFPAGKYYTYQWKWNDSLVSTAEKPILSNIFANNHTISLVVSDAYGKGSKSETCLLPASYTPISSFSITSTNNNYRVPATLNFKNSSQHTTQYFWKFSDGSSSTTDNPVHTYLNSGDYYVKLAAICHQDTTWSSKLVTILPKPSSINVKKINVWLDTNLLPDTLQDNTNGLDLYCIFYVNGVAKGSSIVKQGQTAFPVTFSFSQDLNSGGFLISNLTYSSTETFSIKVWDWDNGGNLDDLLLSYDLKTKDLQSESYPTLLKYPLNSNTSDKVELTLQYNN